MKDAIIHILSKVVKANMLCITTTSDKMTPAERRACQRQIRNTIDQIVQWRLS
jgi:hypothetical protein